jgi:hypothetical protein
MAGPIDAIKAIHNAIRNDISAIDDAALVAARGDGELSAVVDRYRFFNEVLDWHAHGEEIAVFPAIEGVAPEAAEAYEKDHRGLDALFESLNAAISSSDALVTARVTAVVHVPPRHPPAQGGHAPLSHPARARRGARAGEDRRHHG